MLLLTYIKVLVDLIVLVAIYTETCCICRACLELSFMTPDENYIPQLPLYVNNEVGRPSGSQETATPPGHKFEDILPALPPSFSTLVLLF
ncbi:hypothetical protein GLYMA_08G283250v4 [Glycine max]|nr:hypothetical protein GLYMA_08G283250v4 [Glycine max]KAH1053527.1 hypothetical protein GYH30_022677 [Glycine max]